MSLSHGVYICHPQEEHIQQQMSNISFSLLCFFFARPAVLTIRQMTVWLNALDWEPHTYMLLFTLLLLLNISELFLKKLYKNHYYSTYSHPMSFTEFINDRVTVMVKRIPLSSTVMYLLCCYGHMCITAIWSIEVQ